MSPVEDHRLRYGLANELHTRPFPTIGKPAVAAYLAIKQQHNAASRDRDADRAHLIDLLDRFATAHPPPGATHFFGQLGKHRLKWESHTEFVTYTIFRDGTEGRPFDASVFDVFPQDWLAQAPGKRMTSALIYIGFGEEEKVIEGKLNDWFVPESLAVSKVLDDSALVAGDFRIDPAGHVRFAVFAQKDTGSRRTGRIVQRLCEIETYKMMSMLGFHRARLLNRELGPLDERLTRLVGAMTGPTTRAGATLTELQGIAAELENIGAQSSFRFGATGAYEAIVNQRVEVLREVRFQGRQTFGEFMMRRFDPAMRTVKSAERQLSAMADRAIRAGELLRTQVDVVRSAQNQRVLESMDRRADLQLRLQRTVEGLSVVAVSYYAVNLVAYLIYPVTSRPEISKGLILAGLTPVVVLVVWAMMRRIRARMH